MSLGLRTFYFNRDKDQDNTDSIAAAQAFRLDYASPHHGDLIGFTASLFASAKLHGENGRGGTSVLRDQANGDQSSYWKLGQAYLTLNLPFDTMAKAGRMVFNKPLLEDSDSRATPSSTQALLAETTVLGTSLYAIASDKASGKTEGKFISYQGSDGDDFVVYVVGAERDLENSVMANASYGFAENIMHQGYVNVTYERALPSGAKLQLDAHQYLGEAIGDGALASIGAGYGSALSNLVLALVHKNVELTASYQTVKGDTYQVSWDGNHDETDFATKNSVQRLDFNRADEDSLQLRIDYDFDDFIDGLGFMARYTRGSDIKRPDGREGREWERNFELYYAVPFVERLSIRWRNSTVRSSETFGTNENRMIVNYSHELF